MQPASLELPGFGACGVTQQDKRKVANSGSIVVHVHSLCWVQSRRRLLQRAK